MLRVVYLIDHKHGALTYTPMLRVVFLIITNTRHSRTPHVKFCVFILSQTGGTIVHLMLRDVYVIYHKHQTLTYTAMLRVVYLIYHKHRALTYTPMLRVVDLIITNTRLSRSPPC